jgi:FAD/FMN-containing dehydrogenase
MDPEPTLRPHLPKVPMLDASGQPVALAPGALATLRSSLAGETVAAGEPGYEEARQIWNAMVERRPAVIARCRDAADVSTCVRFAAERGVALGVRGGGHNIGGRALVPGGVMVDFSARRGVRLDAATGVVEVEPGATLGDLDRALVPAGRVVPTGIVSETGVAGLTLGGGFGWLSRRWGLTCDHLVSADVVTAGGDRLTVDEDRHPDLLWALRGGGGGFAVVTILRFASRALPGPVLAGPIFHHPDSTAEAAHRFRARNDGAPEERGNMLRLGAAPPAPFLPPELHGRPVAVVIACHVGDAAAAERDLAPLRGGDGVVADLVMPRSFAGFQAMFDPGEPRGKRNYWKSEYVSELDDEILAILLERHQCLPTPSASIKVFALGAAVSRVAAAASAAAHRDARFIVVIATSWDHPTDDARNVAWVRDGWAAVHARSGRGGYINFLTEDTTAEETQTARGGVDLERLRAVKRKWDPGAVLGELGG